MPYGLRKNNKGQTCVYNTDTDKNVPGGCHDTHEEALKHQRAMMVNVPDATSRSVIFAATTPSFAEVGDMPIVSTGTYALAGNPYGNDTTFTAEDLSDAVEASQDPTLRVPRIKLGHDIDWADGEPAFGKANNLRMDDQGKTIIADYADMPKWLADILPSAYPNRSIEAKFGVTAPSGRKYRMYITAVSLLGVHLPGCSSLEDMSSLYGAEQPDGLEIEARETVMAAAGDGDDTNRSIVAVATDDVKRDYYENLGPDQEWWWVREMYVNPNYLIVDDDNGHLFQVDYTVSGDSITFGEPQEVKTEYRPVAASSGIREGGSAVQAYASRSESRPQPEGDDVDLTKIRERLGLSAETSDEEVITAAAEAIPEDETPGVGDGEGGEETPDEAGTEADTPDEEDASDDDESSGEPSGEASGAVQVDSATFARLQRDAQAGREARTQQINAERERILTAAVKDGRIPPSRKEHYRTMFASDPEGTKTLLTAEVQAGGLAKNAIPVSEDGEVPAEGQAGSAYDPSWLSPAEQARLANAGSGQESRVIMEAS